MTGANLQQQAYETIRKQIIYSELAPRSKISDKVLEEQLIIGRTPIREALIQLRNQELIKTIPQSGPFVSKIDIRSASLTHYTREKLENPLDRRAYLLSLTKEGKDIYPVIENCLKKVQTEFLSPLSEEEREKFIAFINLLT